MGLAELSSTFFIKTAHYIKKIIVPSRHELYHGAKNSNLLTIKGIQMNQMTQNRCGGVPVAQNGNTKTRFFRKAFGMLLLLAALVMAGGKAWGQVTWSGDITVSSPGIAPYIAFIHYASGTTITITGNVRLKDPLTVNAGETLTIKTDGNGPYTISWPSNYYGYPNDFSPIMCGYGGGGTLTIDGGNKGIIIEGNPSGTTAPCIYVESGGSCTLTNITIRNSNAQNGGGGKSTNGGAIYNAGTLTCYGCSFSNNTNSTSNTGLDGGGAIGNRGTLICTDNGATHCTFTSNTAKDGGAIYNFTGSVCSLTNCSFTGNTATGVPNGGNGGAIIHANTSRMVAFGCTFTNNTASINGGAIYAVSYNNTNPCDLTSCSFYTNHAQVGGALWFQEAANITLCQFNGNYADGGNKLGGAIFYGGSVHDKSVTIQGGTFTNNEARSGRGGAIYADKASTSQNTCDITIESITIEGTTYTTDIHDNQANNGGGIGVGEGCVMNFNDGNVYNNTANSNGGGVMIYGNGGTFNMTGGTIGGASVSDANTATNGGGVYISSNGTLNIDGTVGSPTIQYNTATTDGGGVRHGGTMNVEGVVVIENNTVSSAANNVYLNTSKLVTINTNGLDCGSHIGINNNTDALQITNASGSAAVANAQKAFRNGFFFQDANSKSVATSSTGSFASNSSNLYLTSATIPQPCTFALATGAAAGTDYVAATSGRVTQVLTLKGLAYLAKDVYLGNNYNGLTVTLANDITIGASDNWEPIGYRAYSDDCNGGTNKPFKGTFNGQGHSIINLRGSDIGYQDGGLFGYVEGGTIKNVIIASGTGVPASENVGGIVGYLNGGSVYNCMAAATTPTGGTNRGALVGKIANNGNISGSLYNSFANSSSPLVGNNAGTVANCYVRGASSLVTTGTANYCYASSGSASGTNGTFSAVETTRPYSYNCFDNQVTATNTYVPTTTTANPDKQLVTTLNNWVTAQTTPNDYAGWVRPTTTVINGDYPVLKMPGSDAVASNGDGNVLHYGSVSVLGTGNLLSTYTSSSDAICLYNSVSSVTSNSSSNAEFYINEDVAIESGSDVNAHVGITLKDAAWHMFSPAIANAPLGITYPNNNDYGYNATLPPVSFNNDDGYFPQTNISGGDYYDSWDYYCYYEPEYHWINFKRNGNSHHHEDGNHEHIKYKATPSASVNVNETALIPAKGYLLGTKLQTFLQAEGTLNDGNIDIALTSLSPLRTGYNFIGNPYQAYLDFDAFAENTDNHNIWEGGSASNASYVILESSGYMSYVHGASSNHFGADRYLHPHQGFMVVVKNGATSASFDNNMRKMNTAAFRGEQINYPLVNLIATEADGKRDITTVELGRPDQGGALKQYDLHLGKGSIYTHYGDDDYAIAFTQPGISEVGIRFETDEDATYTLSWDTENGEFSYLHLIDNITGIDTDCLATSEYRFTAKASDYKSRFKLVFGYTGVEENEDGASTGSATFAFLMGNELVVNCGPSTSSGTATLQMFDLMGRMVMQRHVSGTQTSIMMPDMPAGVYVLRLSGNNGTRTQKIVME